MHAVKAVSRSKVKWIGSTAILVLALGLMPFTSKDPALAAPEPSFRVQCYVTKVAPNDPIVFPGQPGMSHMHTFYGNHTTDAYSTINSLLADRVGQCGSHFDTVDRSAYWVPTLYKDGQPMTKDDGSIQLNVYYKRAGANAGALVQQGFPQGLRIVAGDAKATTPQDNVWFKCAGAVDTGSQNSYGHSFPSCKSTEVLIAEVQFPDCWDGKNLDSANHKSHMTMSSGSASTCPSTHPVKLPKLMMEAWNFGVNGPASSLSFASGGAYTFHADFFAAWDPRAQAGLVNSCLNEVLYDCNPRMFETISMASVTQAQIDAQTKFLNQPTTTMSTTTSTTVRPTTTTSTTRPATTPTTLAVTTTTARPVVGGPVVGIGAKCLDNFANRLVDRNQIVLYTCNGTSAQRWTYVDNTLRMNGFCLDVPGASKTPSTYVQLFRCNGTPAQVWVTEANGALRNPNSNLCLDDKWGVTADGNRIWTYTCNGTAAQNWKPTR